MRAVSDCPQHQRNLVPFCRVERVVNFKILLNRVFRGVSAVIYYYIRPLFCRLILA